MKNICNTAVCLVLLLLLGACNVFKFIPPEEKLYTGATLKLKAEGKVDGGKKDLKYELEDVVSPEPNKKIFGARIGLWLHFKAQDGFGKKIYRKLDKRYGEKPVYMSNVNTVRNEKILVNRLENNGYFGGEATSEVSEKERTGSVTYHIKVPEPYFIQTYTYLPDSSAIDTSLQGVFKDSLIKAGKQFDTDLLKEERIRIDSYLKNKGFYYFNPDYLVFTMDTNQYKDKRFDLYISVKNNIPREAVRRYRMNNITVYPDYAIDQDVSIYSDSTHLDSMVFIQGPRKFKPKHLVNYIRIRKGDLFKQRARIATIRKLTAMNIFQYVSIRYSADTLHGDTMGLLNASVQLSPYKKRSLRVEMQGVTKSNNFAGPGLIVAYTNRNLFRGGEIYEISGNASYETQIAKGSVKGLGSFQFGIQNSLTIPRIFPFKIKSSGGYSIPKTKFGFNVSLVSRVQFYRMNSFQFEYGFKWNSSRFISHELNPIDLIYSNVFGTTPEFDAILEKNTFLAQSFEDQFIPGLSYSFLFNQFTDNKREHRFFFKATADIAGNLFGGIQTVFKQEKLIFGLPYAQYLKADIDARHYARVGRESLWITRIFAGWGVPYGKSSTLPYIKQYFSGGPNSIRAFKVRSLGPGSYDATNTGSSFFDQSGDIKLEFNTEFRHPIISILKGAVFFDAGNIWLVNDNPAIPGGKFSNQWYRQIAMGFGYGLRIDIDFLVVRFDFATPLRTPYNNTSEKWVDDIGIWRDQGLKNIVLNFSIGYPC